MDEQRTIPDTLPTEELENPDSTDLTPEEPLPSEPEEIVPADTAEDTPTIPDEQIPQPENLSEQLREISTRLDALQTAFNEKIAEDEYKNQLFDRMHRELTKYQNGLLTKMVDTIALDIIQLADSTTRNCALYAEKEANEENYRRLCRCLDGIAEDLKDILYRQDIESFSVPGDTPDVHKQKIIQIVETDDPALDNRIAGRSAEGYTHGDVVLRPERIKIFKYKKPADAGKTDGDN